jgi:predicted aldo/keto reductase-like oxidoreductase
MTEIQKTDMASGRAEHFWTDMVCRGCGRCVRACPAGIDIPSLLIREEKKNAGEEEHAADTERHDRWKGEYDRNGQPIDCIECGICSIRCPQGFNLLEIVRRYAMKQASNSAAEDEI